MRIVCPGCAAEYEVPASRLAPRKMVRCAQCGGQWIPARDTAKQPPAFVQEEPDHETESGAAAPQVTAMDRLAARRDPPPRPRGLRAAWIVTGAILIAAVVGIIVWRDAVVRAWPPSARVLGLAASEAQPGTPPAPHLTGKR